jgi:hypothetical protein
MMEAGILRRSSERVAQYVLAVGFPAGTPIKVREVDSCNAATYSAAACSNRARSPGG